MLPIVRGEFRAGAEPEIRFAPSGVAVGKIRAVASSRKKQGDEWVDDKTIWVSVLCFNQLAENAVESIKKGDLFLVEGRLQTDDWVDREGVNRTSVEIVADTIGPSLKYATAAVSKVDNRARVAPSQRESEPADNPWVSAGQQHDSPPF